MGKGLSIRSLARKDVWSLQEAWREIYSKQVKVETGKWVYRRRDWHSFSYGFTKALAGSRAETAYNAEAAEEFILLVSNVDSFGYSCNGRILIPVADLKLLRQQSSQPIDFYVFPPDLRWTLVVTHEADCGPYFATRNP